MKQQIVSEYRKLRTTRTVWGVLAGMLALTALGVGGVLWDATRAGTLEGLPFITVPMGITWGFVLILGLRSFTDEFRFGSIVPTLLASPDRRRVLAAKLLLNAGAAVVFALSAALLSFAIGLAWFAVEGAAIHVAIGSLAVWAGKLLAINLLWSAIGVGVGLAVRHQVAAIAGSLVAILVGENIVAALLPAIAKILPGGAAASLAGLQGAALTPLEGGIVLSIWAAGSVALGSLLMERRDIA
jgi:ABC-2 type transport system permease protein